MNKIVLRLRRLPKSVSSTKLLVLGLTVGFVLRLFLSLHTGHYPDIYTFHFWSLDLITKPWSDFYQVATSDYLPGYLYVLWFLGKVFWWFLNHAILLPVELVYKAPSLLTDIGNTVLIYLLLNKYTTTHKAVLTSFLYYFNPAFIINSTIWGQVESFLMFFILLSFFAFVHKKYAMASIILGVAQVIKPVAILIFPFYLLTVLKKRKHTTFFNSVISFGTVILVAFIPFSIKKSLIPFIVKRYLFTTGFYPLTTVNAFNFWAIFSTNPLGNTIKVSDQLSFGIFQYQLWGYILFLVAYLTFLLVYWKAVKNTKDIVLSIYAISLTYFALFLFFTRLHERHFYYSLIFLTLLFPFVSWRQKVAITFTYLLFYLNNYFSYQLPSNTPLVLPSSMIITFSVLTVIIFLILTGKFLKQYVRTPYFLTKRMTFGRSRPGPTL